MDHRLDWRGVVAVARVVHLRAVRQDGEDVALGAQLDMATGLRDPVGDAGAAVRQGCSACRTVGTIDSAAQTKAPVISAISSSRVYEGELKLPERSRLRR